MPRERVWKAISCLAASADTIQERLRDAGLELAPLTPDDFGPDDRTDFTALMDLLTGTDPGGGRGSIEETTLAMSDDQAEAAARLIIELDASCRPLT